MACMSILYPYSINLHTLYINHMYVKMLSGGVAEWLTRDLRIASDMGSNPVRCNPLFPLHSLFSTSWFQERFRECATKLKAFYTIELK